MHAPKASRAHSTVTVSCKRAWALARTTFRAYNMASWRAFAAAVYAPLRRWASAAATSVATCAACSSRVRFCSLSPSGGASGRCSPLLLTSVWSIVSRLVGGAAAPPSGGSPPSGGAAAASPASRARAALARASARASRPCSAAISARRPAASAAAASASSAADNAVPEATLSLGVGGASLAVLDRGVVAPLAVLDRGVEAPLLEGMRLLLASPAPVVTVSSSAILMRLARLLLPSPRSRTGWAAYWARLLCQALQWTLYRMVQKSRGRVGGATRSVREGSAGAARSVRVYRSSGFMPRCEAISGGHQETPVRLPGCIHCATRPPVQVEPWASRAAASASCGTH